MMSVGEDRAGPLVSVAVAASSSASCHDALQCVLGQTYRNLEVLLAAPDGAAPGFCGDGRIVPVRAPAGANLAGQLNAAAARAGGAYLAYVDGDTRLYPRHVAGLVELLEGSPDAGAAYSDLYQTYVRTRPQGPPQVLGKVINPAFSRPFDRWLLCYAARVQLAGLVHRRELLTKTGPFNDSLGRLAGWDLTRRLAFFTDFMHLPRITGERLVGQEVVTAPFGWCAADRDEHIRGVVAVRSARPPKPWPKMPDLSIIFAPESLDESALGTIREIRLWTFVPYRIFLPLAAEELARLPADVAAASCVTGVAAAPGAPLPARVDEALRRCDGDYVAVVPRPMPITSLWVEPAVYALARRRGARSAYLLGPGARARAVALARSDLLEARRRFPALSVRRCIEAAGIAVGTPAAEDSPFRLDDALGRAKAMELQGEWLGAARLYEDLASAWGAECWIRRRAAWALYHDGGHDEEAADLCRRINAHYPTTDTLLLEAKLHRRAGRCVQALAVLAEAERILDGKGQRPC